MFFFSSRRRHTRWTGDWSSDVCSSDLNLRALEDPVRRARRREEDVRVSELRLDALEGERLAVEAVGELGRPIGAPVGDPGDLGAARKQVPGGQLAHLAGADDEDLAAAKIAEDLLREPGRGGRHRRGALADRGLRPRLLPGVQGFAEEPVEKRPGRSEL